MIEKKEARVVADIVIVRVVSRNFINDIIAQWQNLFGANLKTYEGMIQKAITQIQGEVAEKRICAEWYRYEITTLTEGSVVVMWYARLK